MLTNLLNHLTADEKRLLNAAGIPAPRISDWKSGKRLPTRSQALVFCAVTGYDFAKLEIELAEIEAKKDAEKNSLIARMLQSAKVQSILSVTSL